LGGFALRVRSTPGTSAMGGCDVLGRSSPAPMQAFDQ